MDRFDELSKQIEDLEFHLLEAIWSLEKGIQHLIIISKTSNISPQREKLLTSPVTETNALNSPPRK